MYESDYLCFDEQDGLEDSLLDGNIDLDILPLK